VRVSICLPDISSIQLAIRPSILPFIQSFFWPCGEQREGGWALESNADSAISAATQAAITPVIYSIVDLTACSPFYSVHLVVYDPVYSVVDLTVSAAVPSGIHL